MIIVIVGGIVILSSAILGIYMYFSFFIPLRKNEEGFKYVFIQDDGTVRELSKAEQSYLTEKFHPADGGRPYIKFRYDKKLPNGKISGFIPRRRVPANIPISKIVGIAESD